MLRSKVFVPTMVLSLAASAWSGCSNLPGNEKSQGAAIGGVSGAAIGAAVGGSEHRVLGALLGGALGAGGGYVVGANYDKITGKDKESAQKASEKSQQNPATPQDALNATTADLNSDGFVTLDEVVAMKKAGLTDDQMLDRMRATSQVFELTEDQKNYLRERGVDDNVINQMTSINAGTRSNSSSQDVIGHKPGVATPTPPPPVSNSPK